MKENDKQVYNFGKREFKELMVPMSIFILTILILTCIVAIYEACI